MPDLNHIPGYHGQIGPPADWMPETRAHTVNKYDNSLFGLWFRRAPVDPVHPQPWEWPCGAPFPCTDQFGREFEPGFDELVSLRPMRATDLRGVTETIPGGVYQYNTYPPWLEPVDRYHDPEFTFEDVVRAQGVVDLAFTAYGDFGSAAEYLEVIIGGFHVGTVFKTTGFDWPGMSSEHLEVSAVDWNQGINDLGQLTVKVVATDAVIETSGSKVKWRADYQGAATVVHDWAHEEVCLRHLGYGFVVDAEGFDQPAILIQPVRLDPGLVVYGKLWMVRPGGPEDLGEPGFDVLAFPTELPWNVEAVFSSYPVVCRIAE